MLFFIASLAHNVEIDGVYYILDEENKTAMVTYKGMDCTTYSNEYSGSVVIPETINYNSGNYNVTSIGESAFYYCYGLTSITIPNSITSIGKGAFSLCSGLKKVNYIGSVDNWAEIDFASSTANPTSYAYYLYINGEILTDIRLSSAERITDHAFNNCINIRSVKIGSSITSIGSSAFEGCSDLTSVVWNARNCADFSDYSCSPFYDICSQITSFTFGNEVEHIPSYLCYGMSVLKKIIIPNSVTSIGSYAFDGTSVTSVVWNAKNCVYYPKSEVSPFYNSRYKIKITSFTFGNEVEDIPAYLCYMMTSLTSITIPNSVTSIGSSAFENCIDLTSVSIPNKVTSIGEKAFSGCNSLTSIVWNAKYCADFTSKEEFDVDCRCYIYNRTSPFYDIRSQITSFTFGNEVEHIPAYLCCGMTGLNELTIPNSVTSIGSFAFEKCSGLNFVEIGSSVTSIGGAAFYGCSGVTKVNYLGSVDKWAEIDFAFPYDNPTIYVNDLYINGELLTDVRISLADSIKNYAFLYCTSIKSVEINNRVTSIGSSAFEGCSGLTFVEIRNSVTSIGFAAFRDCSRLTSVTIPNSVTSIDYYAFYNCSGLTSVTIPNSVTSIGKEAFYNCSGLTKVNYLGSVDKWVEIDFYDYDSNPTYYAKDLYINNELLTDVKITSADSIKNYAFYNCQSIKFVMIGNHVTSIGGAAFCGCSGLTSIEMGNCVTSIGGEAFYGCSGLTKVNYLDTVDKWVEIDFENSYSNPTYYANDLYINNELLTDVKITTADFINDYAFYNCQSIKSVEIGESVKYIGSSAFGYCDKLRKVTSYPTTVPNVYEKSFEHYKAVLYVPCDVYYDYFLDDVFGKFKEIKCITAEEVEGSEKVEIEVDSNNNATIIWPSTGNASSYELVISKNGEVFCTLLFNENGQLTSIDFGNRSVSVGFQFTVTGLDAASKYSYSIVAKDEKGNELESYNGTFTTNGYSEVTAILETLADANITVSGGTISADTDFTIYNTIGQNVTAQNGSLTPGVYVVKVGYDIAKVMVK